MTRYIFSQYETWRTRQQYNVYGLTSPPKDSEWRPSNDPAQVRNFLASDRPRIGYTLFR